MLLVTRMRAFVANSPLGPMILSSKSQAVFNDVNFGKLTEHMPSDMTIHSGEAIVKKNSLIKRQYGYREKRQKTRNLQISTSVHSSGKGYPSPLTPT